MSLMEKIKLGPLLRKLHWKELLAVLFILLAVYFFRQQRHELMSLMPAIERADRFWVITGILVAAAYIVLQAVMYRYSFRSVGGDLDMEGCTDLFLKRNLLSIFLPAGGVSSLAYLPPRLRRSKNSKQQVHQASGIYGFTGIFSVFLVGIPVVGYAILHDESMLDAVSGLVGICLLLGGTVWLVRSFQTRGYAYRLLNKYSRRRSYM
jgi:phosphatidylglycerol lysyltransferase